MSQVWRVDQGLECKVVEGKIHHHHLWVLMGWIDPGGFAHPSPCTGFQRLVSCVHEGKVAGAEYLHVGTARCGVMNGLNWEETWMG